VNYKTITLEMIEQNQPLYNHLRRCRTLLTTMEQAAVELRTSHREWISRLKISGATGTAEQLSADAMELALAELKERLQPESVTPDGSEPSLDGAIAYLKSHSRRG